MAILKYQCNNCEPKHVFNGDKYTSECPICKSQNIEQLQEDKFGFYIKFIQDNWKILAPVFIGLLLILFWPSKVQTTPSTIYIASLEEQKNGTNFIQIKIEKWDSSDGHWLKSKINLSENEQIDKISKYINYLSITGKSKQIIPIENKIYLCDNDTGIYNSILIEYKSQIVPPRFKKPMPFEFHLNGSQPDSKANCDEVCNLESKNIRLIANNCTLKVKIKNASPNRTVLVSVDGINGHYKQLLEWDIKPIKKYDVWVKYEKSTCSAVASLDNNGTPPNNSCKECKSLELALEFTKLLNAWGKDPNNRDLQIPCNAFYKSFIGGNNKFLVNGKVFHDWSDMEQKITNENADDRKTFTLKKNVIISSICSDVTIEFIYD
jgi:hypothetical protein